MDAAIRRRRRPCTRAVLTPARPSNHTTPPLLLLLLLQWQQAVANGSVNVPAVTPDFSKEDGSGYMAAAAPASIGELMAFSGQAPELINGR